MLKMRLIGDKIKNNVFLVYAIIQYVLPIIYTIILLNEKCLQKKNAGLTLKCTAKLYAPLID